MGETHPAKIKIFEMADQIIYVDVLITLREKKPATPHVILKAFLPRSNGIYQEFQHRCIPLEFKLFLLIINNKDEKD